MSDLRGKVIDQVFAAIASEVPITHDRGLALSTKIADAALAYIRQHDGHAEFVRKVREFAENMQAYNTGRATAGHALIALCDAEIAKETSNG